MGASHDEGGVDWRRLASDRNVSLDVARNLWERAQSVAPNDPGHAERAFHQMLDAAAIANVTHEPGRETLVADKAPSDAASLGPGKSTLVLQERNLPTAPRPTNPVDTLKEQFDSAIDAGKRVVEVLAQTDPEALVAALRELTATNGSGFLQRVVSVAERLAANKRANDDAVKPPPPPPKTKKKKRPEDEDGPDDDAAADDDDETPTRTAR